MFYGIGPVQNETSYMLPVALSTLVFCPLVDGSCTPCSVPIPWDLTANQGHFINHIGEGPLHD
jgi:hypothetical protein